MEINGKLETTSTSITRLKLERSGMAECDFALETTSTSITRLKPDSLDFTESNKRWLETTSTSITRLKLSINSRGYTIGRRRSWNDKYLDYEIETTSSRLYEANDLIPWNDKYLDYEIETLPGVWMYPVLYRLETTSTSITRLKPEDNFFPWCASPILKRQEPRLRDWNPTTHAWLSIVSVPLETTSTSITRLKLPQMNWPQRILKHNLKRQVPRLRDWNRSDSLPCRQPNFAWNDKYLDYEIETKTAQLEVSIGNWLETTSTSITRLKLSYVHLIGRSEFAWNDKYLDYEIETLPPIRPPELNINLKRQVSRLRDWNSAVVSVATTTSTLETTSTSITRLKPCRYSTENQCDPPWNDKNLDYEIETREPNAKRAEMAKTWNDKNLDYEIETWMTFDRLYDCETLKRQEPRLRDWNYAEMNGDTELATWNDKNLDYEIETRAINSVLPTEFFTWNDKNLDYEIETNVNSTWSS